VVINGESWGVYVSAQQFNTEFLAENFKTTKGARWKVSGSPNGRGGLDFIGDDAEDYKARYEMKSGNAKDWEALVELCRTLSTTPLDELEAALKPMLDIDKRPLVPRAGQRPDQQRRVLGARQRLQHLPRSQGCLPHHPARHE
jgi:spore coat protein CotH